jgi:teichuronic acid biosynthesis glycosyltransferase TuaC
MLRVAIVTTSYPSYAGDPAGHFVETEARARSARGDDVIVIAPGPHARREEREEREEREGVRIAWLPGGDAFGYPGVLPRLRERPLRALPAARFVLAAKRTLARLSPDTVIAHWLLPSAFPVAAAGTAKLEVVVHGTDLRVFEQLPMPARRAVARRLVARDARVRCVSQELRARLVRAAPSLAPLSRVEPCAIDVRGTPSRSAARRALGVSDGERLAVIAGRLVPSKRPVVATRLALARGATRVVVLGDGPLARELAATHPRVAVLGLRPRDEALTWLAAADLVVSASRHEGAPTVIREARALGTAVLAVPAGDLRDWARADAGIELVEA